MGLRDKLSRNKESEMDKWSDEGTADWLGNTPPPPAFKLKLKSKPQSIARQPKPIPAQNTRQARQQMHLRQERLRRAEVAQGQGGMPRQKQAPAAPVNQPMDTISININLPKFQLPKVTIPWPKIRKWGVVAAAVLLVFAGSLLAIRFYLGVGSDRADGTNSAAGESDKPSYQPIAPKDKQNLASGDDSVSAYDPKRKLYTFNDNYQGTQLTISQQPLPKSFKSDPIQIRKAADSIRATEEVDTALGMAYIGFDEQANVQRIMLIYRDLLVFIMTNKKLDKETIKTYIETLN
jgi:hypothetical protein